MRPEITPDLKDAVMKTLYHHPQSSEAIVWMITGETFEVPPMVPTEEEKELAGAIAEELIERYYCVFRAACVKVLGEDLEVDWD